VQNHHRLKGHKGGLLNLLLLLILAGRQAVWHCFYTAIVLQMDASVLSIGRFEEASWHAVGPALHVNRVQDHGRMHPNLSKIH
jgi:hypothetical protein